MKIVEVKHPLVKHKLGLMREQDISTKRFRELASEVGSLLTYEATADLETEKVTIEGWNGPVEIDQIKGKKITVVPILRAGLGMMDGVLENVPSVLWIFFTRPVESFVAAGWLLGFHAAVYGVTLLFLSWRLRKTRLG